MQAQCPSALSAKCKLILTCCFIECITDGQKLKELSLSLICVDVLFLIYVSYKNKGE